MLQIKNFWGHPYQDIRRFHNTTFPKLMPAISFCFRFRYNQNRSKKGAFCLKIIECVPNFSEGRDAAKMQKIAMAFANRPGVKLLDYSGDYDHNRMVVTAAGEPQALRQAALEAIGLAVENIDLRRHQGEHPRIGACDVMPFIPLYGVTEAEAQALVRDLADEAAARFDLPIFLYEHSAQRPERQNLANIRQGGFEALGQRIAGDPAWAPDFGPACIHPSAGATAMGVRAPLIAYNINLNSNDLALAKRIASKVRARDGGLPYCKALGIELAERGIVQVSMNMTDYRQTALWQAYEAVEHEANAAGVEILESELIGLSPLEAIIDCARHYLRFTNIDLEKILEMRIFQPENKQ